MQGFTLPPGLTSRILQGAYTENGIISVETPPEGPKTSSGTLMSVGIPLGALATGHFGRERICGLPVVVEVLRGESRGNTGL